jgi:hypothetical protein
MVGGCGWVSWSGFAYRNACAETVMLRPGSTECGFQRGVCVIGLIEKSLVFLRFPVEFDGCAVYTVLTVAPSFISSNVPSLTPMCVCE